MAELGGMLALAILKVVGDQIGSAIGGQITLQGDFSKDLKKMKMALESVETVLQGAERRSITEEHTCLWLKRLKDAMYDISDMIDEFEADTHVITQPSIQKFSIKKHLVAINHRLPIVPKIMLANRMETMRIYLEDITSQRNNFNLLEGSTTNEPREIDLRETSSTMSGEIFGRIEERDIILASLSDSMTQEMTILPIYGIGGLGKTTLAKLVFNSSQFKNYSQVWVHVSQTFDLKKIGNLIISQLSEKNKETWYTVMEMVNRSLRHLLAGKKILVVLDDLWEENKSHLDDLKAMLNIGEGSKVVVIVTTRDKGIANNISTTKPHELAALPDAICWSIIEQTAGFKSRDDKKQLEKIGKDIASKCGGVALAAHSVGRMLNSMSTSEWKSVRDSDIWSIYASDKYSALASLRLSYSVMPSDLKLCFAYCAIFPKGYNIVKIDLIHQWISLGFIQQSNMFSSWQLGEKFIRQLLGLSFLQDSKPPSTAGVHLEDDTSFTMHDLVHDLAIYVLDNEILIASKHGSTGGSCYRYALHNDCTKLLESSKIRALRFQDCSEIEIHGTMFLSANSMRVLDLSECCIRKLPNSIGGLKQLRYLNAPRVQYKTIPGSITRLSKLIYLNLSGSSAIKVLPKSIGDIEGLMYLDLSGCSGIQGLPESIKMLKKLVHLDLSNCSQVNGISLLLVGLAELQHLNLSYCKNIGELPEALDGLSKLQYLNLAFSSYLECCKEAEVLGALTNLEYLSLSSASCDLEKLPEALGSFTGLKYLNLSGCHLLEKLPYLFGNLESLVLLDMSNCYRVNDLSTALDRLTNLQYLNLSISFSHFIVDLTGLEEVIGNLSKLRYLNLSGTMNFIGTIETDNFICRINNLSNLEHLDLSNNLTICRIPESICNLTKLHTLNVSGTSLARIPESICAIDSLKFLCFNDCHLSELPQLRISLISLPHFVVHASDGKSSSNLALLRHTNPDVLEISGLENVKSVQEAEIINLMEKKMLKNLKFEWTRDAERSVDDKLLLEKLVPPSTLKALEIHGYNGVSFPAWLMGQLPNLNVLDLRSMKYLEEWNNTSCSSPKEEHVIDGLVIRDCPRLRLKSLPPRVNRWMISNSDNILLSRGECTISYLDVECSNLPMHQWVLLYRLRGLTFLGIKDCYDLTGSSESTKCLSSLETLNLETKFIGELPQWLGKISSLQNLKIKCRGVKKLHEDMRQLTRLQSLELTSCKNMASLPHWLGELTSLKKLSITNCAGISSLPEGIQQLTNLHQLFIMFCPALKRWCESEENKMKLAHIKNKDPFAQTYLDFSRIFGSNNEVGSIYRAPGGKIKSLKQLAGWNKNKTTIIGLQSSVS